MPLVTRVDPKRSPLAELAEQHGLRRVGARPPLREYLPDLWTRRHFIWSLATAKAYSRNQNNHLGQLWAILTPLLLAGVYFLVFGYLLGTREGVDNYTGFLVVGVFTFTYIAGNVSAGSSAISGHLGMVRALRFPRAVLPVAVALSQFLTYLPAIVVMVVILLITGETPDVEWLLLPVALLLLVLFNVGVSFVSARLVVAVRDVRNLIPLTVRLARYFSGVFFSIERYTERLLDEGTWGEVLTFVLQYQPVAVFLDLVRATLMGERNGTWQLWTAAAAWAVVLLVVGFLAFWKAEDRYGRD